MLANACYVFPDFESTFSLPPESPSRAERIAFERLRFNLVRISNQSTSGNRLVLDLNTSYRYFTHKNLKSRFKRQSNVHPTDITKGGLLIICKLLSYVHYLIFIICYQVQGMVVSSLGQLTGQDNNMPALQTTFSLVLPNLLSVEISLPTKAKPMSSWKMTGGPNTAIDVVLHVPDHIVAFFSQRTETVMMMIGKSLMGYQCNL